MFTTESRGPLINLTARLRKRAVNGWAALDAALHLEHMTLLWIKLVRIGG